MAATEINLPPDINEQTRANIINIAMKWEPRAYKNTGYCPNFTIIYNNPFQTTITYEMETQPTTFVHQICPNCQRLLTIMANWCQRCDNCFDWGPKYHTIEISIPVIFQAALPFVD